MDEFAVFILSNGRPDRVKTYHALRRSGYSGSIYILIDDLDKTREDYLKIYDHQVVIFDKKKISETFDSGDNFEDFRAIVYARNASFEIAKNLGIKYFIQLDDDYTDFQYRFDNKFNYLPKVLKNLDEVFRILLEFYKSTGVGSIAMAQGGDFIGGYESANASSVKLKRKCMNSFVCSTDRPFKFVGRVNEDVNTYTRLASTGLILVTTNQVNLNQLQSQSNSGGMTEMYQDSGTYVKSFYSVMYQPSSVRVRMLSSKYSRLHHSVNWKCTVPLILSEDIKKV